MKWNVKSNPKVGEERIISKFLVLPKCLFLPNGISVSLQWRWLEKAKIVQIYKVTSREYGDKTYGWRSQRWV